MKRYSVKCLNDCHMKADSSKGIHRLLDCLKTCDSKDRNEDNGDDNHNVDNSGDDEVDGVNGDIIYY